MVLRRVPFELEPGAAAGEAGRAGAGGLPPAGEVHMDSPPGQRAVAALLKFDTYAEGTYAPESTGGLSAEEFELAVEAGLLFRPNVRSLTHDEVVESVCSALRSTPRRSYTDAFLAGLSSKSFVLRAGLSAYAAVHRLTPHAFAPPDCGNYCAICGVEKDKNVVQRNWLNRARFEVGGLLSPTVPDAMFYLQEHARHPPSTPLAEDFRIFSDILRVLSTAAADETVKKTVARRIAKIPGHPSTAASRQVLLETLGYCGILETAQHGQMLDRFVRLAVAPRKTHSSDWQYPVDFWTGADGLNRDALSFWFGCYPELSEWTVQGRP